MSERLTLTTADIAVIRVKPPKLSVAEWVTAICAHIDKANIKDHLEDSWMGQLGKLRARAPGELLPPIDCKIATTSQPGK